MMRGNKLLFLEIAFPVLVIAAWLIYSQLNPSLYFPRLVDILASFFDNWFGERFLGDLVPSILRFGAGYLIACVAGVALGVILGSTHIVRRLSDPLVSFFRSLPSAALLPVALQIFGVGSNMKVALIAFVCLWPVLLNTSDAIDEIDQTLRDTTRTYRIGGWRRVRMVYVPSAGPRIFAGMRTALAMGIAVMIISEMFASTDGIGHFLTQSQRTFAITDMWSGILLLGLIGYVLTLGFSAIEARILNWYFKSKAVSQEA
jgi:ABC-type nitrate/sulfonate/bicarbonate transport system permease component